MKCPCGCRMALRVGGKYPPESTMLKSLSRLASPNPRPHMPNLGLRTDGFIDQARLIVRHSGLAALGVHRQLPHPRLLNRVPHPKLPATRTKAWAEISMASSAAFTAARL